MPKKRKPTNELRFSGLVKAMNTAHERLSVGIPANEVDGFRKWVRGILRQVEQACQERKTRPDRLPAPTFRAYLFLKSIDLDNLPIRHGPAAAARQTGRNQLRINNLVTLSNRLEMEMETQVMETLAQGESLLGRTIQNLLNAIQEPVIKIEEIFRENQSDAADLPDPSRRVYQWLKFLSEPGNLEQHLAAMALVIRAGRESPCRERLLPGQRSLRVYISFEHTAVLYRTRVEGDGVRLTASEAFVSAPDDVLEALACIALLGKISPYLDIVNRYVDSEEFAESLLAIDLIGIPGSISTRGRHHDLAQSFDRVNAAYFQGRLTPPRLTWSRTVTVRKMGHYQPAKDTVMISLTLDNPEVPEWVLDYVVYHEVLHRELGIQVVNGRRYVHTPAFREAERRFSHQKEAEEFLTKITRR